MTRLILIGAGGHGKVVADTAEAAGWTDIAFLDDSFSDGLKHEIWPVIGRLSDWKNYRDHAAFFISIGDNRQRQNLARELAKEHTSCVQLTHPKSIVSQHANVGCGSIVMAGSIIQPFVEIGEQVIINTASTIDHDCTIGSGSHVSPGVNLAGNVILEERCWIGIGSSVRQGCCIGADAVVGAGTTIVKNVPANAVVVGGENRTLSEKLTT